MQRILSTDIKNNIGKEITLYGWIHSLRDLGGRAFLILRDRAGTAQVLLEDKVKEKTKGLMTESVLRVVGKVKKEDRAPSGAEVVATDIEVLVGVTEETPIVLSKKELNAGLETVLDNRAVSLRHPKIQAIFQVQDAVLNSFDAYFRKNQFVEIKVPETVGVATEGGTDVFEIKYFDKKAYLVQSPQLYKQMLVGVFERVFTVTRVFRAELHNTSRHMNESTQLDMEMGFVKDHTDALEMATEFFKDLNDNLAKNHKKDFELLGAELPKIPDKIPSFTLKEAVEVLATNYKHDAKISDLSPEDERNLCEYALKEYNSDFVYVTGYPDSEKPFYIYNDPDEPTLTRGFDILFRGLEISSGGQRVHEYETLVNKMKKRKMNLEHFEGYLQAFKYGMPPHAGWSIGLERMTMQLLGLSNVREASLFPRDLNRLEP